MIKEEKELYDFLSQPTEFEQALIVLEYMPKLRWHLLDQFWDDVKNQLELWRNAKGRQWRFEEGDRHGEYWNLSFTKTAWPAPRVGWQIAISWSVLGGKPLLGIWVAENASLYDYPSLRNRLAGLENLIQDNFKDITLRPSEYPAWWPVMYRPVLDFSESNYRGLTKILPEKPSGEPGHGATLATQLAKLMIDWLVLLEEPIDRVVDECKGPK